MKPFQEIEEEKIETEDQNDDSNDSDSGNE